MTRWWRRNRHWFRWLALAFLIVGAATGGSLFARLLMSAVGLALNLGYMAVMMIVQVVFYFGFVMFYLGGTKTIKIMPGQAGEVTLDEDYWGQPELVEVARQWVRLLEEPAALRQMGGQPVTGVLLSGPPGSGKTHLARCMAGSAAVPFLGLDGSRLISMWMGVGSVKVMRLFGNARKLAKRFGACIVFVDELDSIGSSRGGVTGQASMHGGMPWFGAGTGVLNTLLAQLDGINEARGGLLSRWYKLRGKKMPLPDYTVFVLGATNRPDVLDPALTRAGRLDVKIRVDPTDKAGRIEIINNYLGQVQALEEIDVEGFAADTTGMTPADLKTIILRRAPARAIAQRRKGILNEDLRASLAEQNLGLRQPIAGMVHIDRRAIAYHEAGHAVVTWALTDHRIARVSIVRYSGGPHGGASLGHVSPVPVEERWSRSAREVAASICVALGGRAAELEFLGVPHMGASSDMDGVRWRLAQMALEGLFSRFPVGQEPDGELLDEMNRYLAGLMALTRATLRQHAEQVHALAEALLDRDELDADTVLSILQGDQEETKDQ